MKKVVNALIVIPLALIFIVFAVANRRLVTVSFDPFDTTDLADGIRLPLFAIIILAVVVGIIAGGVATWLRQGHWRRAARRHEADAREAQARLVELRAAREADLAAQRALAPATVPGLPYTGQDNRGATL